MATQMNEYVTHADLMLLRDEMRAMEERINARISVEISRAKYELLTWGIGILLVNDGILLSAIKLLN